MSDGSRLGAAGPRARLPGHDAGGTAVPGPDAVLTAGGPVRTCVGCRGRGHRSELLRVVRVDDGTGGDTRAVVDVERARPGRGAWLHPDLQCLELAERRRALPRALRSGPLDITAVREHLEGARPPGRVPDIPPSTEKEAGWKPMDPR